MLFTLILKKGCVKVAGTFSPALNTDTSTVFFTGLGCGVLTSWKLNYSLQGNNLDLEAISVHVV